MDVDIFNLNLKQDSELVLRILDESPIGISIATHPDGKRVYTNPRFNELFTGDRDRSMLKEDVRDSFVYPEDFDDFNAVLINQDYRSGEFLRRRIDGAERWCLQSWRLIPEWGDGVFMVWHFDITERKEATLKLEEQAKEMALMTAALEENNKQKDRLFSILAHDLVTPFDGLMGFSQLLHQDADKMDADKIKEYAGYVHSSAENLHTLLRELLDWSRFQMQQFEVNIDEYDLKRICAEVIDIYEDVAAEKDVSILNMVFESAMVKADRDMLKTVLRNLLSNAIKFSNPGGRIWLSKKEDESHHILQIADNGVGMSETQVEKLFSIGQRKSTLGTTGEIGTGLGLNISKDMIEAQGGQIKVLSELGQGTTFTIFLPKTLV